MRLRYRGTDWTTRWGNDSDWTETDWRAFPRREFRSAWHDTKPSKRSKKASFRPHLGPSTRGVIVKRNLYYYTTFLSHKGDRTFHVAHIQILYTSFHPLPFFLHIRSCIIRSKQMWRKEEITHNSLRLDPLPPHSKTLRTARTSFSALIQRVLCPI